VAVPLLRLPVAHDGNRRSNAFSGGSASQMTASRENSLVEGVTGGGGGLRAKRVASNASSISEPTVLVAPIGVVPNYDTNYMRAPAVPPPTSESRGNAAQGTAPGSLTRWMSARLQDLRSTLSANTRSTNNH
jgi:hypothetical protein